MSGPNIHLRGEPKTYEQIMAHADLWKRIANRYDGSRGNKNPANPDLLKNALDEVRKYERKTKDLLAKNGGL